MKTGILRVELLVVLALALVDCATTVSSAVTSVFQRPMRLTRLNRFPYQIWQSCDSALADALYLLNRDELLDYRANRGNIEG